MAKIILDALDTNFIVANNNSDVRGLAGNQTVSVNAGVTGLKVDSTIEDVDFAGAVADYNFQETGAGDLAVYSGATLLSTIQGAAGKTLSFTDGTVAVAKAGLSDAMTIGGTAITTTAASVTPTTIDAADKSSLLNATAPVTAVTYTLTDADETDVDADSVIGTTANDTITGISGTLDATDVIIDSSTTDADTLNVTMAATNGATVIQGIETINASWDSFAAAAFNATSVTGAAINLSSAKSVHTAGTTITGLGANNLTTDSIMTGTLVANGVTTSTINAGVYTTVTANATADTAMSSTIVANSATIVNVDGKTAVAATVAANTANITIAKNAVVNVDDIATVTLTAASAATATLTGTTDVTTLTIAGASDTVIGAAELMTAETITDSTTAGTLRFDIGNSATVDATKWATTGTIKATHTGLNTLTTATGATVELDVDDTIAINGVAATAATNTATVNMDTAMTSLTLGSIATATLTMNAKDAAGTATNKTIATLDVGTADVSIALTGDTNATTTDGVTDMTITTLTGGTKAVTLTGTGDVTLTSPTVKTLDASGLTGELVITNFINTTADSIVKGATGANTVEFDTTTGDVTYTGQNGVNTITVDEIKGTTALEGVVSLTTGSANDVLVGAVDAGGDFAKWTIDSGAGNDSFVLTTATTNNSLVLAMGEGNDTVTADTLTTSTVEGSFGAGNDILSLAALSTGSVDVQMGEGNDTVTINAVGTSTIAANAAIVVDLGNGTDTLTIGEATALDANVNLIVTGGTTGTDTVYFDSGAALDLTAANIVLTNVDQIQIDSATTVNFSNSQLSGKSYEIAGVAGDAAVVEIDNSAVTTATVTDLSLLTFNTTAGTSVDAVTIQSTNLGDTITGTNDAAVIDTITTGTLADTVFGLAGADVIKSSAGADTFDGGAGNDTFYYSTVDTSTATVMDTINNAAAGDILAFDTAGDGTTDDSALAGDVINEFANGMATGTLAASIAADTTLSAAITEFLSAASFLDDDVAGFVYGGDSYVVHADANNAAGNIVKLAGIQLSTLVDSANVNDEFTFTIA